MGDFLSHILPGTFFLCIGLWHLVSTIYNHVTSPKTFKSRTWHPIRSLPRAVQPLELYFIILATAADIFYKLGPSSGFQPLKGGVIPLYMVSEFEQAGMLLVFFLFASTVLLSEWTPYLPLPPGSGHALAAISFGVELLLFHYHAIDHTGLESQLYTLLTYIIAVNFGAIVLLLWYPKSFLLDVVTSACMILQGTWFYQMALSLYVKGFIPLGCNPTPPLLDGRDGPTVCNGMKAMHRAGAVMNLAFNLHVVLILFIVLVTFGVTFRTYAPAEGYTEVQTEMVQRPNLGNGYAKFAIADDELED